MIGRHVVPRVTTKRTFDRLCLRATEPRHDAGNAEEPTRDTAVACRSELDIPLALEQQPRRVELEAVLVDRQDLSGKT